MDQTVIPYASTGLQDLVALVSAMMRAGPALAMGLASEADCNDAYERTTEGSSENSRTVNCAR